MAKKAVKKAKITPKMERFCQEYLLDLNASGAARRAGYKERSAGVIGHENLRKPEIQARIMELRQSTGQQYNITKEGLMSILMDIARGKVEDITDPETGAILPPSQWPDHMKGVVSSIEADEIYLGRGDDRTPIGVTKKVKLWEKTKAIEQLARMMGFNAPDKIAPVTPDGEALGTVINVFTTPAKKDD